MLTSRSRHILVAEDNPMNQLLMKRLLKQLGHTCAVVENGLAAIQAMKETPFDIILMDVQMPELDGIEATRRIRATPEINPQPLIIVLTANHLDKTRAACLDAGANEFLTKPVSIDDLEEAIEQRPTQQSLAQFNNLKKRLDELLSLGDPAFVHELVDLFIEDSQNRLQELAAALAIPDWDILQKVSHLTKGSSSNMGADSLRDLCMVINDASLKQDLPSATVALRQAMESFALVREQLIDWKNKHPA